MYLKALCRLLVLVGVMAIAACKTTKFEVKDGKTARDLLLFNKSTDFLLKEFSEQKDPVKQQKIAEDLGDSYARFNDWPNAEKWYKQSIDLSAGESVLFKLGLAQKQQEKYTEAIRTFEQYQRITNSGFEGRKQANQSSDALAWKKNASPRTQVKNITSLNTGDSDRSLEFFKNGQLVLSSSRDEATGAGRDGWTGEKFTDIFITDKKGSDFTFPANFGAPVNTAGHESTPTFSSDYKEMYFVRCAPDEKANAYCHIYYTAYNNEHWNEPVKLNLFGVDTINVYDPFLSKDGKTLLVAANPEFGLSRSDIFMFTKVDSGWSAPKNLGPAINTPGNERYPWLDEKGNLYFSSDGQPGMGGLDIFKAVRSKSGFKDPQNLRYPINSGADDFGFRIDKYKPANGDDTVLFSAYLTSNRAGGKGSDDIYRVEEKWVNLFVLNGKTLEKQFENLEDPKSAILGLKALPKARVELKTMDDKPVTSVFSDTGGRFFFRLQAETDYKVSAGKNDYFNKTVYITTKGKRSQDSTIIYLSTEIELEKIFKTKLIEIPNIYYDYDSTKLREESKLVLDTVFLFFKENPDLTVEIGSHTDSRGTDSYNQKLSQGRAQSVVDYLVQKGIPKEQLLAKGYGETMPVNKCVNGVKCTEEEYQKNRRTTFRVVSAKLNLESIEPEDIKIDPKKEGE